MNIESEIQAGSQKDHVQVWYLAYDEDRNGTGTNLHTTEHSAYADFVSRVFEKIGFNKQHAQDIDIDDDEAVKRASLTQAAEKQLEANSYRELWMTLETLLADDSRSTYVVGYQWLTIAEMATGPAALGRQFGASY